jgi:hypothetical protein
MGISCPIESLPEWKELVESGVENPYTLWSIYNGEVPLEFYGQTPESIGREKATAWVKNTFGEDKIFYYDYIKQIGNRIVHGHVTNGAINVWKAAEVGAEFHEGYHLMFRTMLSDAQRSLLYAETSREFGKPTDEEVTARKNQFPDISDEEAYNLVLEEKMAEGFRMHMLTEGESSKTIPQKIKQWFSDLFDFIKAMLTDNVTLKQTYSLLRNSKTNYDLLGRKILRNPELMKSDISPEMHVQGMPSEVVEEIIEGISDMVVQDIQNWKNPDINLILGDNKTAGTIVHGLLSHLYRYKDGREAKGKDITPLREALTLEKEYNKYRIAYENTKRPEFKDKMDEAAKVFKEHKAKFGLKLNNFPPIVEGMSEEDLAAAKNQRQIREYIYKVIDNWRGKYEAKTGNVITRAWRDEVERNLRNYGYIIKSGKVTLVDIEEGDDEIRELDAKEAQEHLHNQQRIERPHKERLSQAVKIMLRRFPITETVQSGGKVITTEKKNAIFSNRPKYHDPNFVYKQLLELWSDTGTFEEMMIKLENFALHRDDYKSIARGIRRMSPKEKSALFSNFATTVNKTHIVIMGKKSKIFDSNVTTTEQKAVRKWRNNAIQVDGQAIENSESRALYNKNVEENEQGEDKSTFTVNKSKLEAVKESFKTLSEIRKKRSSQDKDFLPSKEGEPSVAVIALANTLWNLGINFGNDYNIDETIDNLQSLMSAGMYVRQKKKGLEKLNGKGLFDYIVENSGLYSIISSFVEVETDSKGVPLFGDTKKDITPFFDTEKSGVKFLGSLAPLFMSNSAESHVNGEGKAIWPIQHRTPVDDIIINIKTDVEKNGENALKLQKTDPFHIHDHKSGTDGYSMIYRHMILNPQYLSDLRTVSADVIKRADEAEGEAYGNFNTIDHIFTRLYHFINNGKEDYFYCAIPTQADREDLEFMLMPRLRGHGNTKLDYKTNSLVFRDMILQDLLRIRQAQRTIDDPNATKAIDYHTGKMLGIDGSGKYMQLDGINSKTGERIVQDYMIKSNGVQMKMSDYVEDYIKVKKAGETPTGDLKQFENLMSQMISNLTLFYDQAAEVMAKKIIQSGRYGDVDLKEAKRFSKLKEADEAEALEGLSKEDTAVMKKVLTIKGLLKEFIIHEDVGTAEIIKLTRGNRAAFASLDAFTKRQRLLGTPGTLTAIRGTLGVKPADGVEEYGMIPEFNESTFLDPRGNITKAIEEFSKSYVSRTMGKLKSIINPKTGDPYTDDDIAFMLGYNPGTFEDTDGLAIISIDMYRYIAEGLGEWGENEIEAFRAYKKRGSIGGIVYQENFVPKGMKAGDPVIIKPLKPYYEDVKSVGGVLLTEIQKNAYFPLVEDYTRSFPIMDDVRQRMELSGAYAGRNDLQPVHVFNAFSTKKSLKTEPYNLSKNTEIVYENGQEVERYRPGMMEDVVIIKQDSSKLRFPQIIPDPKGTSDVIFNRQAKKNSIANVDPAGLYYYNSGLEGSVEVVGDVMTQIYHNAIEEKIRRDMESVDKEIGLDKFRKAIANLVEGHKVKGKVNISHLKSSEDFINAKLELLKNIRTILEKQAIERDMSQNYLDALDITIDPDTLIPRFAIPLDYPVFGKKFQSALLSIYNNNVFKQRLSGTEAVQTAALGGFETNETLKFLEIEDDPNNTKYGVRLAHAEIMIRADVLRKFNLPEGEINLDNIPEELRRIIGYRIPNQDKASMVILKIKAVLPDNYAKAIVVPPQLVKLMGSDFDVDKMFLLFPEVSMKDGVMVKESANYAELASNPELVTKLNEKQLNNIFIDTMEAVLSSPIHFSETLSPLDTAALGNIKDSILEKMPDLEDIPMFTGGMYHTNSAVRNLLGNKLRGKWSNALAGRNVAQHLDINLFDSFAVKIAGEKINTKFLTQVDNPFAAYDHLEFTDKIISRYLNAAVDASKNPFHYIINDNEVTFPVEVLWINFYGDTELMHFFLNQPIIRDFVNIMSDKYNNNLAMVNNGYRQAAALHGINPETEIANNYKRIERTTAMSREDIMNFTLPPAVALRNFMKMYSGGRQIVEMFKVITPDSMDGLNRVEAMQAYMERMEKFANPKDGFVDNAPIALYGRNMSESIIEQVLDEDSPYGLQRGYYKMISETLGVASILFPMTLSSEFIGFKNTLRKIAAPPTNTFTSDQHRDINSAIIFTILTRQDSPLKAFFGKGYSDENYRTSKNKSTLLKQMSMILKKYPKLAGNEFFVKITEDPDNKNSKTFRSLQFDAQQQYTVNEKDRIINDLTDMLYRPEKFLPRLRKGATEKEIAERKKGVEDIKTLGNKLAMHTLIANGFKQTPFNFADLLPPRFLTQPMDRTAEDLEPISISDYLHEQAMKMANGRYFEGEDMLRFLRIFGEMRPGGSNLLQRKNFDEVGKPDKEIDINLEEYSSIPSALVVRTKTDSDVYILGSISKDGKIGKYMVLGKTTNEKKHLVGGATLYPRVVGKSKPIDSVIEKLDVFLDNTMDEEKKGDITQICML